MFDQLMFGIKPRERKPLPAKVTDEMVTAALAQIITREDGYDTYGLKQSYYAWQRDMKAALEAALKVNEG